MDQEDFDPEALHALVDGALAPPVAHPCPPTRGAAVFAAGVGTLFAAVAAELEDVVAGDVAQRIVTGVRDRVLGEVPRGDLATLHALVRACRACPGMDGDPALPAGNLADPDVVVVTELPPRGARADAGVLEAFRAAGFGPARLAHTSVVRCDPTTVRPVEAAERRRCVERYLFSELACWRPRLIVTMGSAASEAVCQAPVTLGEERGQVLWCGPWAVLPTYSLGYTARRPEAAERLAADLRAAHTFCYGT